MAEHPLLIFPEPARAERAKRRGGGGKLPGDSGTYAKLSVALLPMSF